MNKLYISVALSIGLGMGMTGCNDAFLDKAPITTITEDNAFQSYDNFKLFMWPCYEMFKNGQFSTSINGTGQGSCYSGDLNANYLISRNNNSGNQYAFGRVPSVSSGNGWNYGGELRRVNIMLSKIDNSSMTIKEKDHWRAVGNFFHSYWYIQLVNNFGDVPWVTSPMNESSEERFDPKLSREIVVDSIMNRLLWAEENIGDFSKKDGPNTINKDCIQALISRFALREATWRKYHGLGNYEKLLNECVRVSKILMDKYHNLYKGTEKNAKGEPIPATGYGEMWTSESLKDVPGIILYMEFAADVKMHNFSSLEHMDSGNTEMPQNTVDLYLCVDGKPISTSEKYEFDETNPEKSKPINIFRNRDPRLYQVVMPPYNVIADNTPDKSHEEGGKTWRYSGNPEDREFIDYFGADYNNTNPGVGMKRLPAQNWSGTLVPQSPNILGSKNGAAFVRGRSGYYFWKNWTTWEENKNGGVLRNTSDKPIFKIEEVMLNYAEAKYELGQFTPEVANATINKLRERAGVEKMNIDEITDSFDPKRPKWYPKDNPAGEYVEPLLWEIRRERIVELMGEGFGFYDIRRWRMAPHFMNQQLKGMWQTKGCGQPLMNADGNADPSVKAGYIWLQPDPVKAGEGWQERYYLYQIPTQEIILNPNLAPNNPGWE